MRQSLDNFIRDALHEHDGVDASESPTQDGEKGPAKTAGMGTLPGHAVEGFIARGGMGAIYRARQMALEREVAVKVMTRGAESPEMAERFRREALVLGRLAHPNIVPVYDIGTDDEGQLFYTMKLVKGRTLQAIINDLRDGDAETLRQHSLASLLVVFRKVCDAMAFAHSQGVLHRDLKPENIMVGEFGEVLVMDWGLAKRQNDESRMTNDEGSENSSFDILDSSFRAGTDSASFKTLDGAVLGTPQYMSPEQARGEIDGLDVRSDIFSLGGILYTILTLRPPVEGTTLDEVLEKVKSGNITAPTELGSTTGTGSNAKVKGDVLDARLIRPLPHVQGGRVPPALSSVAMKALQLDKTQRYQNVTALSADIEAYQGGFATSAEHAGALRQVKLLMLRHKAVTASLLTLLVFSIGFVLKVMASERRATQNAVIATANEQLAKQNEKRAVEQEEETRRALARSQIALAEAAFRSGDLTAMVQALDSVPEDLRNQVWVYLSAKRDASLGELNLPLMGNVVAVAAVPGQPECFALAQENGRLQVVNARTCLGLWEVKTDFSGAMVLAFTADGSLMALTAKGAAEIWIMRASDRMVLRKLPSPSKSISRLVFSPNAGLLVCGERTVQGSDVAFTVLDASDGSVRWQATHGQTGIDFSRDGTRLFTSCKGGQRFFRTYDAASGKVLANADANVFAQAMSGDGKLIALGLQSGEVVIIDVATGSEMRRAKLHGGEIQVMAWTAGGHLLTSGADGGIMESARGRRLLRLWDAKTFAARGIFFGLRQGAQFGKPGCGWAFQTASGWLVTDDEKPQRWLLAADIEAARIWSTAEQGWTVAFPSDALLLSRREYGLGLADVSDPRHPIALPVATANGEVVCAVDWRTGLVATARGNGGESLVAALRATDSSLTLKREIPFPQRARWLDFDAMGERLLAVMHGKRNAIIFDVKNGTELLTLPAKFQLGFFAGVRGDVVGIVSEQIADAEVQDSIAIFDGRTGGRLRFEPQRQRLNSLAVSPDRRLIAVAGEEQVVHVLDADTLEERHRFRAHDDDIRALAFHPSLPVLASASNDGTLKLWDYESATLRQTFYGIDGPPVAIAFSPNGRLLALEAQETVTRLYDLAASDVQAAPVAKPVPVSKTDAEGWLDLLGAAKPDTINTAADGWRLENGELHSSEARIATVPLPSSELRENYILRATVRQSEPTNEMAIFFPVADRTIGINFDMWPPRYGSVLTFGVGQNNRRTDVVWGRKFTDLEKHTIEVTVRVRRPQAQIEVKFDGRPHYQWSGPLSDVTLARLWKSTASGEVSVGANAAHWIVSEVKVKPLE